MSNLKNHSITTILGGLSLLSGYNSLERLLTTMSTKAIILQTQLTNTPELTQQVYQSAKEIAEGLTSGDYILGVASAFTAGLAGGAAIYNAHRK